LIAADPNRDTRQPSPRSLLSQAYRIMPKILIYLFALLKTLAYLLIAVAVVIGGASAYVWYDTRAQVERLITAVQPLAAVRYGSVRASLLGNATVNNIVINPNGIDDEIRIASLQLNSSNLFSLFNSNRAISHNRLPKSLTLSLRDMELNFYGDLLRHSYKTAEQAWTVSYTRCGKVTLLGPQEFEAMGYNALHVDLDLAYNFDEPRQTLNTTLALSLREMLFVSLETALRLDTATLDVTELVQALPKLAKLSLTFRDASLNERHHRFCAEKTGLPLERYLEEQELYFNDTLRSQGITLGPGLAVAYRDFLQHGDQFVFSLKPAEPLAMDDLPWRQPETLLRRLQPELAVNQRPVSDLSLVFQPPPPPPPAADQTGEVVTAITSSPAELETVNYRLIPFSALVDHVGEAVIVYTTNGREHRGKLEAADSTTIKVVRYLPGGSVSLTLWLDGVDRVLTQQVQAAPVNPP
jgi:hypothetical protein